MSESTNPLDSMLEALRGVETGGVPDDVIGAMAAPAGEIGTAKGADEPSPQVDPNDVPEMTSEEHKWVHIGARIAIQAAAMNPKDLMNAIQESANKEMDPKTSAEEKVQWRFERHMIMETLSYRLHLGDPKVILASMGIYI